MHKMFFVAKKCTGKWTKLVNHLEHLKNLFTPACINQYFVKRKNLLYLTKNKQLLKLVWKTNFLYLHKKAEAINFRYVLNIAILFFVSKHQSVFICEVVLFFCILIIFFFLYSTSFCFSSSERTLFSSQPYSQPYWHLFTSVFFFCFFWSSSLFL